MNIVHIHVNDVANEVTLDVRYLSEAEGSRYLQDKLYNFAKYEKFALDITGRPLRYKILVYNMSVVAVLYNTGASVETLKFWEVRINTDDYCSIRLEDSNYHFGRVTHIPLRMLSTPDKKHIEKLVEGVNKNECTIHC